MKALKVYGIKENLNGNIEIQSVEVAKETAKKYWLKNYVGWNDYRETIYKDEACLTEKDALKKYMAYKNEVFKNFQERANRELAKYELASVMLSKLEENNEKLS